MKIYLKDGNYTLAKDFPMSVFEIRDTLDRLRKFQSREVLFRLSEFGNTELPQSLCGKEFSADIYKLNLFAERDEKLNYPKAALNSAIITVCAVVLTLLTNTFVAYAVARNMDKRFFRFLYYFFLAMMFVPFTVIMLPIAKEMGSLHLDNQLGLIILYTILGIGTNLFIAIGFIRSIPISLEEAARIDGASTWRIFWTIIFPLMGPINATIAILTALWAWNDFLLPLITLTDQSNQTIPLAQYVFQSQFTSNYPMAFASYLMAMAPVLIVYIFAQKWVVGGVMRGAVK